MKATMAVWYCPDCIKFWETTFWPDEPELCPYCKGRSVIVDEDYDKRYIIRDVEDW